MVTVQISWNEGDLDLSTALPASDYLCDPEAPSSELHWPTGFESWVTRPDL